jgi:hypothetical protein
MLNFVGGLLEGERDPRSLALSHFLANFLQNLASCHTAAQKIPDTSFF